MRVCDINPHLRFASVMRYAQAYNGKSVKVKDCRIFYVTEGSAQLYIAGKSYVLAPNSLFYCCAGSEYTIATQDGFSLISLNFDLTQEHNAMIIPFSPATPGEQEWQAAVYADRVADSPFLNTHLYLSGASGLVHHLDIPPKIAYVKDYIQQHYTENITNRELADLVGYHEYYLNRIFAAYTGTNLHEYLLKVRLNRASFLILNTDLDLKEIPEKTGFRNYPHFSSYFKKVYGYAPAEYRKRLKGNI